VANYFDRRCGIGDTGQVNCPCRFLILKTKKAAGVKFVYFGFLLLAGVMPLFQSCIYLASLIDKLIQPPSSLQVNKLLKFGQVPKFVTLENLIYENLVKIRTISQPFLTGDFTIFRRLPFSLAPDYNIFECEVPLEALNESDLNCLNQNSM